MLSEEVLKMKIIQKAWEDPIFKAALLSNPKSTIKQEFGIQIPDSIELVALEEKPNQFYLIIPANPTDALNVSAVPNAMW